MPRGEMDKFEILMDTVTVISISFDWKNGKSWEFKEKTQDFWNVQLLIQIQTREERRFASQ